MSLMILSMEDKQEGDDTSFDSSSSNTPCPKFSGEIKLEKVSVAKQIKV